MTKPDANALICSCGHWYHLHVNGACTTCGCTRPLPAQPITPGYTWHDEIGPIRVMAVAEGYAMCRRPGALPFVWPVKELRDER